MRFAKRSNMLEIFSRSLTALIAEVSESYKRSFPPYFDKAGEGIECVLFVPFFLRTSSCFKMSMNDRLSVLSKPSFAKPGN